MIWNEAKECMSRDELHNLQSKRLVKLVDRVYHNVEFYRKKMQAVGVEPGDIRDIDAVLLWGGINRRVVGTVADYTGIFTGDTAHEVAAVDFTRSGRIFDDARNGICAHKTAHAVTSGKYTGEMAVADSARVLSCQGADLILAAAGLDLAGDRKILHQRGGCQIAEQTLYRAGLC